MRLLVVFVAIVFAGACKTSDASNDPVAMKAGDAALRFQISVTKRGFEPEGISVPAGKPVTLVFERKTDGTCAKEVVIDLGDGKKVEHKLPLNKPVEVVVTFPKAGTLGYACSMDMVKGTIVVQ